MLVELGLGGRDGLALRLLTRLLHRAHQAFHGRTQGVALCLGEQGQGHVGDFAREVLVGLLEFGGVGVVRAAARAQAVRAQIVIELADGLLVVIDQSADVQLGSSNGRRRLGCLRSCGQGSSKKRWQS
jgi:hypothetical protein